MHLRTLFFTILFFVQSTVTSAFEANVSREEELRLDYEILFKDLSVGETMLVNTYEICAFDGKFFLSGLSAPMGEFDVDWKRNRIYFKAKRMPSNKVTLEIMPRQNGGPYKEKDFVFSNNCRRGSPFYLTEALDINRYRFEVMSINGFTDARSLWKSFEQIDNQ